MSEYKHEAHSWRKPKRYPWMVCQNCGLVALKNPLTEWAIEWVKDRANTCVGC